ncbi:MAG: S24/S26 family peptidase [Bacteroidaceae bacterium]|nr:S24/S26 family peptidase [Bacteroidaceae bacterium]
MEVERKQIKVDNHIFMQEVARSFREDKRKSVTFTVFGISMHPFLGSGRDKVVLTPPAKPKVGQVVLAEIMPQRYALHRIIKIEGNTITMRGDGNPLKMVEQFTTDKLVGTAEGFIRKGNYVSTSSRLWRCYSAVWQACNPLRRLLLIIYRRLILKNF